MDQAFSERFGSVQILRADGYSKTFAARDNLLRRDKVIVKLMSRNHVKNFRDDVVECLSWVSGVQHHYLATVLDAGLTKKQHLYYVREYVPSSESASVDFIAWMKCLVSAIDFLIAHARVHGAIKPSNILGTHDALKLTDIGIGGRTSFDNDEEWIHYIAPEILQGGTASAECDLYALGAVLYNAVTGRHLFNDVDKSRLKSKYLSVLPRPALWSPGIPNEILKEILELLNRNPEKRVDAFERIKSVLDVKRESAERGAFVGREVLLRHTMQMVEKPTTGLRVLLVQGEPGIGKSRFAIEVRLHSVMRGFVFVTWQCNDSTTELSPIFTGIDRLKFEVPTFRENIEKFAEGLSHYRSESSERNDKIYALERIVSELILLLSTIARRVRIVLAIEDIHQADTGTVLLLHQLALRGPEIPLTAILTCQPREIEPQWLTTIRNCIASDFVALRLTPLSQIDSEKLIQFLEDDGERQRNVLELSAGNPLLIQEYSKQKSPFDSLPGPITNTAVSMLSGLTKDTLGILQILSVFQKKVQVKVIGRLSQRQPSHVAPHLTVAETLGIIDQDEEGAVIRIPIIRNRVYESLSKKQRVSLNRSAFLALREIESDKSVLADHAFKGEMFFDAANIHRELARSAFESYKYRDAAIHYESVRKCNGYCGDVFLASDRLNLARCYEWLSRPRSAWWIYRELLTIGSTQNNSELLSAVYERLAWAFKHTPLKQRINFQEQSIQCLPTNAASLHHRYAQLSRLFTMGGDLVSAEGALQQAQDCLLRQQEDLQVLTARALLLVNRGDFRGALRVLFSSAPPDVALAIVANNIAYCFEHLGDLKEALRHIVTAEEVSIRTGNTTRWALSIANRGAIKLKLGEIGEAERLLMKAHNAIRSSHPPNNVFGTIPFDAALLSIHTGNYRRAWDWLKKTESNTLTYDINRLFGKLVLCRFFITVGLSKKASDALQQCAHSKVFNQEFFQIERSLIEAQLLDIPAKNRLGSLQQALRLASNLGTQYQQCEVQTSLSALHLELDEMQPAEYHACNARELAERNGYKVLRAQAVLLRGLAAAKYRKKQRFLSDAFQLASEMRLQELVAESAYHLGVLNLDSGNLVTAREYLIRSTSITARLADEVPASARRKYLSKNWRRDAITALEKCNAAMPADPNSIFNVDAEKYFAAVYQFTMAASAANSVDTLLASINKVLATSFNRSAVITLNTAEATHSIPVRIKASPEITERVELIRKRAKSRIYFESADTFGRQVHAWIPLKAETVEGGIYLTCRLHESQLTEKEIELLTMIGTIGSSALNRLETRQAQEIESRELSEFHGMIGSSKQIKEVFSQIQIAAGNTANVLIEGESGTGKELVARAIHAAGPRAKQPFIPVDCGAIPESLVEAELFGSRKGSYTGAFIDRPGLFESAHRGTIFLDEISNTTPALQAKLLRVIQEREVRRIGETKGRSVDVRLIVASNQNLQALADSGQFRKDLLFRLKVLHIKVPPLRVRRDDIPMLAHAFLQKLNTTAKTKKNFAGGVLERLSLHEFIGNVRELQNAIERAFFLSKNTMITEIPLEVHTASDVTPVDDVQIWFKELSEGRKDFWSAIHTRYKRRDISREKVVALVDFGLRATRGSYTTMASMFRMKQKDYRRFMDFLRRNDCLLDFRPYRKAAAASGAN